MNTAKMKKYLSLLLVSVLGFTQTVEAAVVTLASSPIANLTTEVVHPNVMFVLDNSGSMAWNYLPDYVSSGSGGTGSQPRHLQQRWQHGVRCHGAVHHF
jgi:type IV pilus assembly protein PilY1